MKHSAPQIHVKCPVVEAFGLQPPSRLLLPKLGKPDRTELKLGYSDEMTVVKNCWEDGTCVIQFQVPCENLPHCHYCECGSEHLISVSAEQAAKLKGLL